MVEQERGNGRVFAKGPCVAGMFCESGQISPKVELGRCATRQAGFISGQWLDFQRKSATVIIFAMHPAERETVLFTAMHRAIELLHLRDWLRRGLRE